MMAAAPRPHRLLLAASALLQLCAPACSSLVYYKPGAG